MSRLATSRPAFCASALIPAGVMSGVPTMSSCLMLWRTVSRPLMPITMAAMPNAISTTAATTPPNSKNLRMTCSFRRGRSVRSPAFDLCAECRSDLATRHRGGRGTCLRAPLAIDAGFPHRRPAPHWLESRTIRARSEAAVALHYPPLPRTPPLPSPWDRYGSDSAEPSEEAAVLLQVPVAEE